MAEEARKDIPIDSTYDPFAPYRQKTIADREDAYHAKRRERLLSPERQDAFAAVHSVPMVPRKKRWDKDGRSYAEVMKENQLQKDEKELMRQFFDKLDRELEEARKSEEYVPTEEGEDQVLDEDAILERDRQRSKDIFQSISDPKSSEWESESIALTNLTRKSRWDATLRSEWSSTTPSLASKRSRWDETPDIHAGFMPTALPDATPAFKVPIAPSHMVTPDRLAQWKWERELDVRNKSWADEELDAIFPQKGYEILTPPATYEPIRTPARKLMATPTPMTISGFSGFFIQEENALSSSALAGAYGLPSAGLKGINAEASNSLTGDDMLLANLKPEDFQFFSRLSEPEDKLSTEEAKEHRILRLLLRIKNGTPPMRKHGLRSITDKAKEFGPNALFNQILPLLMSPSLDDQERHVLVKVIDRVLYKLDDLIRPYVHKILVVIEPMLIDEDYYARVEGREIISNLAKAAGLATMIAAMRPDIDHVDEYVRNTTARAFAVVASALGIPVLLPFLKAVCKSKKSWQARHTGIKIIQQISILMGCAVLPHLKMLVECIAEGMADEHAKVRTMTALSLSSLAESSAPYGIESFDTVLKPLWRGIRQHRGKVLAAFLKAIGFIIPLMDAEYANYYTKEVMVILIREFASPDEEMKKIVLRVVKQCAATQGVDAHYLRNDVLPEFFKHFWVRRMALDRRNYRQVVETTVELAIRVGTRAMIERLTRELKDENESFRRMVMEAIDKLVQQNGLLDIDFREEELLMDGLQFAFQEQSMAESMGTSGLSASDHVTLSCMSTVVNTLYLRAKRFLPTLCAMILWRLNNKSARVRQQASELIVRIADMLVKCGEDALLSHMGQVLYEYLGEEYPEVLASILSALKSLVSTLGMEKISPPIKDLLPRLTPILRNRHEKVQESCIQLVGTIADRGSEHVSAREWMRISFELLDLLKSPKKSVRRSAVSTFGFIARAIGPHDVLITLLNNLKVQERTNRICTTVAIAIVSETCGPFTVLPALMNEYRVPELNVQNGVLKSLSFLFEYIGELGCEYVYAIVPLLEDALTDRDLVHRQTAAAIIKHVALDVYGRGYEDALTHLLNLVWPNIFESSPHVIQAVMDAIEALMLSLGPLKIFLYILSGLFHPARKVRQVYWRIYNQLYLFHSHSLVAAYPRVLDEMGDSDRVYVRYELEYIL